MAKLTILGTAPALPDSLREYTYMVLQGKESVILIDCASSPLQRLAQAGVNPHDVDHLIITHHHPDHVYGVPVFLLGLWLAGRQRPLHIYGPSLEVGAESKGAAQHRGLGRQLMGIAEGHASREGYRRLAVIAALGTRGYYRRLGYRLEGSYMVKDLAS